MEIKGCFKRCYYLRVNKKDIYYVKFIFEGYDGLAVVSTENVGKGILRIWVPPGREAEADALIEALSKEIFMERLTDKEVISSENSVII